MIKYRYLFLGDFYRNRLIDGKLYDDHNFFFIIFR